VDSVAVAPWYVLDFSCPQIPLKEKYLKPKYVQDGNEFIQGINECVYIKILTRVRFKIRYVKWTPSAIGY
jgi:hypothetical protein